ncbi:hypothetical protein Q8F55_001376 [Vanrija albida]|uniref:Uncharacterized protein n=1 Tax=Vanrija albida TaxID=181172 RepID=A0ABR3QFW4_9TREE
MEDLIATLNGNMHVSQELAELENFKAHLARTLVIPAPISPEMDGQIPRARAPSLANGGYHLDDMPLPPSHQPFPSPVAQYAGFDFGTELGLPDYPASSFTPTYSYDQRAVSATQAPSHAAQLQEESIAALQSAFAGDAFASSTVTWAQPAVVNEKTADPWRMFQSNGASVFGSFGHQQQANHHHNALGFGASPVDNEPVPQYSQEDESMDEDMAEAALDFSDEERATNDSYYPDPYGISRWQ